MLRGILLSHTEDNPSTISDKTFISSLASIGFMIDSSSERGTCCSMCSCALFTASDKDTGSSARGHTPMSSFKPLSTLFILFSLASCIASDTVSSDTS